MSSEASDNFEGLKFIQSSKTFQIQNHSLKKEVFKAITYKIKNSRLRHEYKIDDDAETITTDKRVLAKFDFIRNAVEVLSVVIGAGLDNYIKPRENFMAFFSPTKCDQETHDSFYALNLCEIMRNFHKNENGYDCPIKEVKNVHCRNLLSIAMMAFDIIPNETKHPMELIQKWHHGNEYCVLSLRNMLDKFISYVYFFVLLDCN